MCYANISVKRLVRLWIAKGFLNLKEEAKKCLKDLIDRCPVLSSQKSLDGRTIKTCRLHDLVRELCLREAQINNFFCRGCLQNVVGGLVYIQSITIGYSIS